MEIKAIFLDFDWTLFDHKTHDFNKLSVDALNLAHNKGVKLFINSARSYYALDKLNTFNLIPFDGFVINNGGATLTKDKIIYADFINSKDVDAILTFLNTKNYSYNIITLKNTYIKVTDKDIVNEFYSVYYEPYPLDISLYKNEEILAIQVISYYDKDLEIIELANKYNLLFNRFAPTNVELTSKEFLKSKGVKAIKKYFNLSKNNIMAFGDDLNDLSMFKLVNYSVCMGNGNEEAKKEAFYVTDNIENGGIYKALKYFNII